MRRHTNEWWVRILRTKKMGYVGIRIATINGDRNTCKHFICALLLIYFAMWKVIVERLSIIVTNLVETIGDGDQDLSSDVMNCDERRGPWCLPQRWGLYTDRLCFTSITNTKCTHAHTHTKGTHTHTHTYGQSQRWRLYTDHVGFTWPLPSLICHILVSVSLHCLAQKTFNNTRVYTHST